MYYDPLLDSVAREYDSKTSQGLDMPGGWRKVCADMEILTKLGIANTVDAMNRLAVAQGKHPA